MLHITFQGHRLVGSGVEDVFNIYRRGGQIGHVTWTVVTWTVCIYGYIFFRFPLSWSLYYKCVYNLLSNF